MVRKTFIFVLLFSLFSFLISFVCLYASSAICAHGSDGIKITIEVLWEGQGNSTNYVIPVRISENSASGAQEWDTGKASFRGNVTKAGITGTLRITTSVPTPDGSAVDSFQEAGGIEMRVVEKRAASDWYSGSMTATSEGRVINQYTARVKLSADLTPLIEAGYEFAPAGTTEKTDDNKTVTTAKTRKESGAKSKGAAATACAALAAAAALITLTWGKTVDTVAKVGNFLWGLFRKKVAIEPAPPPVEPQPPVEPPGETAYTPPFEPEATLSVTSQQLEEAPGTRPSEEKLRKVALLNAERRNLYYEFRSKYDLGDSARDTLLGWLEKKELPVQEIEARANLLVLRDKEYREFYSYVASKAVDNYADGKLWEQAAKLHPLIKYGSKAIGYATMPFDIATGGYEYEDAQAAQRTLDYFVKTYAKPESEVAHDLSATKDAIKFWNRKYNPAEKDFKQAELRKREAADGTGIDRSGMEAEKAYDASHADMVEANEEIKNLEAERRALVLRLKIIRGELKGWIVK